MLTIFTIGCIWCTTLPLVESGTLLWVCFGKFSPWTFDKEENWSKANFPTPVLYEPKVIFFQKNNVSLFSVKLHHHNIEVNRGVWILPEASVGGVSERLQSKKVVCDVEHKNYVCVKTVYQKKSVSDGKISASLSYLSPQSNNFTKQHYFYSGLVVLSCCQGGREPLLTMDWCGKHWVEAVHVTHLKEK